MKIENKIQSAANSHINATLAASYNLLAVSAWFETTPFKGFAHWMLRRSDKNQTYAMEVFRYVKDRIGVVELLPVDAPKKSFKSPKAAYQFALKQQENVTKSIHEFYATAIEENDYETQELLYGLAGQQVIEEKATSDLLGKLEVADADIDALLHIDYVQEKES